MKKVIALFLLLVSFCSHQLSAQEVYGWNLNDVANPDEVGPCRFDIGNPSQFEILRKHDYGICAGAFVGKKYYVYTYRSNGNSSTPLAFGTYDFNTGDFTEIADYSSMETLFYDMTYDYQNNIMYALGFDGFGSTLLQVNLSNGHTTEIKALSQQYVALACNLKGELFVEDSYGYLTQLDADGNEYMLNGGDVFPELYFQSMTFDHQTGKLYWIAPTTRGGTQIVDLDPASGYANDYYELENERQIVGLDMPYSTVKPKAPGEITALSLQAETPGSLTLTGSFNAPSTTSDGSTLNNCTIHILRNGNEILKKEVGTPGESISFTDQVETDGLYTYTLYAENESGKNEEVQQQIFLGIDTPASVSHIKIEKTEDGNGAFIQWTAPTVGVHGGYLGNEGLKYDVVRQPDGNAVATQTTLTECTDAAVTRLDNYHYVITPTGQAQGPAASSESVVLGTAHTLPYECTFTDEDMVFWNIIDRNQDNVKWKRNMTAQGVSCSYSNVPGDDWLISYPVHLKKEKKYKVSVEAAAYSEEYPEKMSIYLGKGMSETHLDNFVLQDSFIVKNAEGGKEFYTTYYTATDDQLLNLAIQMHSDPDMFALNVYQIIVKEAAEGSVQGTVVDTKTNEVLEGVKVIVKNDKHTFETMTDSEGHWKLEKITEGFYNLTLQKKGYALHGENIEVSSDQQLNLQTTLRQLEKVTINGKIINDKDNAVAEAFLQFINTEDNTLRSVESMVDGSWSVELYEGTYSCHISALGYHFTEKELTLTSESAEIAPFVLKGKPVAPRKVTLLPQAEGMKLQWETPVDAARHAYYQGEGVAHIGVLMYTPHSIVGSIFRQDMALTQVSWQTDGSQGKHEKVDLVIFKLDEQGEPTSTILYEKSGLANTDNVWSSYELDEPLLIHGGALIAFRYNGNIAMMADAGTNEGLQFTPHVHVINNDYTQNTFEYLDQHNMEKNLLIEINAAPLTQAGTLPTTTLCHEQYKIYRKTLNEDWILLGHTDKEALSYTDISFPSLPMGTYQYAVSSSIATEESDKALSATIGKDLTATIKLQVTTNAGDLDSEPTLLLVRVDQDSSPIQATKISDTEWVVENLDKGIYELQGCLDGFESINDEIDVQGTDNIYTIDVEFIERLLPAYNLKAVEDREEGTCTLSWNIDNFFFDDFEGYDPFTLEPATPQNNWIYWDMDKSPTVEFSNLTFKYMGQSMSYMVFNPYETEPNLTLLDAGATPYSGKQYLASFANPSADNRDFIFSPILSFTNQAEFSCQMKNFTNQLGHAMVKIGYTTVEYPKTENDIHWLTDAFRLSDRKWENIACDVPQNAKRMVLLNQTPQGFFMMIDDLFVGEEYPYLSPDNPKPLHDRAVYEVKIDDNIVPLNDTTTYSVVLSDLTIGLHSAQITAVYQSGRSQTKELTFRVTTQTGIDMNTQPSEKYYEMNCESGILKFSPVVEHWSIYDMQGRLLKSGQESILYTTDLSTGCYVLKVTAYNRNTTYRLMIP